EDATIGGDEVVAVATGDGRHPHDRLVQVAAAPAPPEDGIAVDEDPAVGGSQEVTGGEGPPAEGDHAAGHSGPGVPGGLGGGVGPIDEGRVARLVTGRDVGEVVGAGMDDDGGAVAIEQ